MADAEQVKNQTGFSIGGVSPVAHLNKNKVSSDLLKEKTGFCSFIFSNNGAHPMRELFFKKLSKYKKLTVFLWFRRYNFALKS